MKTLEVLKSRHKKAIIAIVILVLALVVFGLGLRAALRTEFPLLAVDFTGMRPALNFGDLMVVQGVQNANEVNTAPDFQGDIIVFRKPSEPDVLITRRAVNATFQEGAWYIRTQADERKTPDWWIEGQNSNDTWGEGLFHQKFLIGKVVGRIPYLGYVPLGVVAFFQTPAAIFLSIALVFLVILIRYPSLLKKKTKS